MTLPEGLLPEGVRDRLPGDAAASARRLRALLDTIEAAGFARVSTPLVEYEESLALRLTSSRTDMARFVDPRTQRTLAIRPDITPQIARLAATQLAEQPRPLRLAYAGPIFKLGSTQLNPRRETMQVGAELVGRDDVEAAIEVVAVAVAALGAAGVTDLTVDLTLPDLVTALAGKVRAPEEIARLDALLDMKDAGGLAENGFGDWLPLLAATGPVETAVERLSAFDHAGLLATRIDAVARIADALAPTGARVTLDPTERHGFEYQSWFGFSLLARGNPYTLARGGSYTITAANRVSEPAMGFSAFPDEFANDDIL